MVFFPMLFFVNDIHKLFGHIPVYDMKDMSNIAAMSRASVSISMS